MNQKSLETVDIDQFIVLKYPKTKEKLSKLSDLVILYTPIFFFKYKEILYLLK